MRSGRPCACCAQPARSNAIYSRLFTIARAARAAFIIPHAEEPTRNKDQVQGNWKQLKGKVKEQWGKLTDNDLTIVEGNMDQLAGRVQERYGIQRDEAERQIKEFRHRNEDLWP